MKILRTLFCFLIGLAVIVAVATYCYCAYSTATSPTIVYIIDPNYVQPPCEAQRRLKEQGFYKGRIDNIWGPESDGAFCNWCAARVIEGE